MEQDTQEQESYITKEEIPFTICFCRYIPENKILLIKREKKPHLNKWNGLGGKLIEKESPDACIKREILEEADIDLNQAYTLHFAGIVSWSEKETNESRKRGMYAYVADFTDPKILFADRKTKEGLLSWKDFSFASDSTNLSMADNIPHFLASMLSLKEPKQFHCVYEKGKLISVTEHAFLSLNHESQKKEIKESVQNKQITSSFEELLATSKNIHKECPWCAKQTIENFHTFIMEEALEVQKAAEAKDYDELKEELGDVFWNLLIMTNIAEQKGLFTLNDVLTTNKKKMIRRHPHVFGNESKDLESIHKKWMEIKAQEKLEKETKRENKEKEKIRNER